MFENPRRDRQTRNLTTNVSKILDLKSSSEQTFSQNCRWVPLITVCGFVASSRVLIFAVIGDNAINIPEIFQVFTIFPVDPSVKVIIEKAYVTCTKSICVRRSLFLRGNLPVLLLACSKSLF